VHASRLRQALDVQLVDMETAAVAQAASLLGVPWVAIKATTDDADDASASSFVANLAAAARASAAAAERLINILR
jgi:adenosylhomocysteine nucleosidase